MTTCPCGTQLGARQERYCTRVCAGRYGGGKRPATTVCKCGRAIAGDNAYANGKRNPRCRHCTLSRGRGDYQPLPRGERANQWTADTAPQPNPPRADAPPLKAAPEPVPAPQRPAWRPAGFTAAPNLGRAS